MDPRETQRRRVRSLTFVSNSAEPSMNVAMLVSGPVATMEIGVTELHLMRSRHEHLECTLKSLYATLLPLLQSGLRSLREHKFEVRSR